MDAGQRDDADGATDDDAPVAQRHDVRASALAATRETYKGGSYTLTHPLSSYGDFFREIRTEGGWVSLPFKVAGQIRARSYVYGMYVEGALALRSSAGNAVRTAVSTAVYQTSQGELFRDEIRAALATW